MNSDPRGYYQILGIPTGATAEVIKVAYRTQAKRLHPDLNHGRDTTAHFQMVNEAYSVLSYPAHRAAYDQTGVPTPPPVMTSPRTVAPKPTIDPYECVDCGSVSPKLRHVMFTQVISFIVGSSRTNIWGIFCEACAAKRLRKASLITGAFGWLSVPGMLYSAHALGRNLMGGKRGNPINMEVCARQALYYATIGDFARAKIAAKDALEFAKAIWWSEDAKHRAAELCPIMHQILDC